MSKTWRNKLVWLFPAVTAIFLLMYRLSDVAGLHRDEAVFGLFADMIRRGFRPLHGYFNNYTSPVYAYVVAAFFSLFGESIWIMRFSGILLNLLTVGAYIDIVRRIRPAETLWTLWFLVTLPAFVVMSRIAGENYSMNPLFLFGGIWTFYVLGENGSSKPIRATGYFLTGLLFCLGVWNHIVFAPTAISVIVVYLIVLRTKLIKVLSILPLFVAGVFFGAIPKIYDAVVIGSGWLAMMKQKPRCGIKNAILNSIYTLGGDGLFIRACGRIIFSFNLVLPACLLGSAIVLLYGKGYGRRRFWLAAAACLVLSFVGTCAITPGLVLGSRLWLLPLWFVPFLLALGLAGLPRWLRVAIGTAIVIVNLTAVGVNYFYSFLQTGGLASEKVYVGGKSDNSWDFMDIRCLVDKMKDYNDKPIYIEDYDASRLKFLLPKQNRHKARWAKTLYTNKDMVEIGSLVALYNVPQRQFPPVVYINGIWTVKKEQLCDSHYEVFEVVEVEKDKTNWQKE